MACVAPVAGLKRSHDDSECERGMYYHCQPVFGPCDTSAAEAVRILGESSDTGTPLPVQTTWLSVQFPPTPCGVSRQTHTVDILNQQLTDRGENLSRSADVLTNFCLRFGSPCCRSDVPVGAVVFDPIGFAFAVLDATTPPTRRFRLLDPVCETVYRQRHRLPLFEEGELSYFVRCGTHMRLTPPFGALLACRHHTVNSVRVCEVWIYGVPDSSLAVYATLDAVACIPANRIVYVE